MKSNQTYQDKKAQEFAEEIRDKEYEAFDPNNKKHLEGFEKWCKGIRKRTGKAPTDAWIPKDIYNKLKK